MQAILLKCYQVSNRNTRKKREICSKLTLKTPERCHSRYSGIFIVTFEHISHFFLVFLLLTLTPSNAVAIGRGAGGGLVTSTLNPIFSKCQFEFRKGYSAQQCLLIMIEKWRASSDQNGTCAALLTDLSKPFDCLPHDLLLAKIQAYGCDIPSLKLFNCYLRNRRQRVKMSNFYSSWAETWFEVPQGCILGPILFNVFLSDLFFFIKNEDGASYAEKTTPCETGGISAYVTHNLEVLGKPLSNWFNDNCMKANPGKYHLLLSGNDYSKIIVGNETISRSKCGKLIEIKIDNHLNFKDHFESLCKKASQKINALSRLTSSRLIMNPFVICLFSYCPVVWMFQSRKLNVRINRLHERALRVVYKDFDLSFKDLLRRDISFNWGLESKKSTFIVSVIEIPIMAHALFTYLFVHVLFFLQ